MSTERISIRPAQRSDSSAMWKLAHDGLDTNSSYFYLIFADRFRDTTVVALRDSVVIGFIAGIVLPDDPAALFIWQIAVDRRHRRHGIALAMLNAVWNANAERLDAMSATVTPSNHASKALFTEFARWRRGTITSVGAFAARDFPSEDQPLHGDEIQLRITLSRAIPRESASVTPRRPS